MGLPPPPALPPLGDQARKPLHKPAHTEGAGVDQADDGGRSVLSVSVCSRKKAYIGLLKSSVYMQ